MHSFKTFITEKVLSIGFNPKHEQHRERYRQQFHDMLRHSYSKIGGYGGLGSGSDEESHAIHHDITHASIKATRRGENITSLVMYKKQHGRKSIAVGTNGSEQGKRDFLKTAREDNTHKRSWAEKSGAPEAIAKKIGIPAVPASQAEKLTGKKVEPHDDGVHYTRNIGGHPHTKAIYGHPKI